jgi:hypothetical protein
MKVKVTGYKKLKVTGLPKYQTQGLVNPDPNDEWIRKIMEYEAKQGGYKPSRGAYGLSNWGYNSRNPTSIEEAIDFYKQDFLPKVQQYPMGMRERAGDFMYNAGRDPRVYMLDQYLRTVGNKSGLPNRSSYNIDINKNPDAWAKIAPQFEAEWNKYSADINKLPIDQQIKFLDLGRDFYYQNIDQVNGQPNPAYAATWQPRVNMWGTYSAPVQNNTGVQNNTDQNSFPTLKTVKNNFEYKPFAQLPVLSNLKARVPNPIVPNPIVGNNQPQPVVCSNGLVKDPDDPSKCIPLADANAKMQKRADASAASQGITQGQGFFQGKDDKGNPVSYGYDPNNPLGLKEFNEKYGYNTQDKTKTKSYRESNMYVPTLLNMGLTGIGGFMKDVRQEREDVNYARKLGTTDASEPVHYDKKSRGRWVMNTPAGADFAPNMMTPVQFRGTPVTEFTGFPSYGQNMFSFADGGLFKAVEGVGVTSDMLGLPTLIENPNDYLGTPNIDVKGPELAPRAAVERVESPDAAPRNLEMNTASADADFAMPLKNFKITSGFGPRKAPFKGASTNHNGVDLAVPVNTSVFSPYDGVVERVWGSDKVTGGLQLRIRHDNGYTTGYAHLNSYNVKVGDRITKGQQIALSGNTGPSTGPHLHFVLRDPSGNLLNPVDHFNMRGGNKSRDIKGLSNWDHNNPGNIHMGDFAKGYGAIQGRKDNKGNIAVFPDMETGLKAMEDLLWGPAYAGQGLTISQAREKFVNGKVGLSTKSTPYIIQVLGGDYRLNDLSKRQRRQMLAEFIKWEDRNVYDKLSKDGYIFKDGGVVFNEGGEYLLDDDDIASILEQGGEIEYL